MYRSKNSSNSKFTLPGPQIKYNRDRSISSNEQLSTNSEVLSSDSSSLFAEFPSYQSANSFCRN